MRDISTCWYWILPETERFQNPVKLESYPVLLEVTWQHLERDNLQRLVGISGLCLVLLKSFLILPQLSFPQNIFLIIHLPELEFRFVVNLKHESKAFCPAIHHAFHKPYIKAQRKCLLPLVITWRHGLFTQISTNWVCSWSYDCIKPYWTKQGFM